DDIDCLFGNRGEAKYRNQPLGRVALEEAKHLLPPRRFIMFDHFEGQSAQAAGYFDRSVSEGFMEVGPEVFAFRAPPFPFLRLVVKAQARCDRPENRIEASIG